jgi:DNA polymerase I-like protein with 3'-5' exonuclease and polymerase domains
MKPTDPSNPVLEDAMKYLLHRAAQGRPSRFVYGQAARAGIEDFEVVTHHDAPDLVAGHHEIWRATGYSLSDLIVRGSVLPLKSSGWTTATLDPRIPLKGPKKWGFKSMVSLAPLTRVDIIRAKTADPDVPLVKVRRPGEILAEFKQARPKYTVLDIEGTTEDMHIVGLGWDPNVAWVTAWDRESCMELLREVMTSGTTLIFHNANYDVAELLGLGVPLPQAWEDTIVLAAMYNPGLKKGLQPQVLSWVTGSTTWKGLVDHRKGYQFAPDGSKPAEYRRLWTEIMRRLGRGVPGTPWQWYAFYNGLDVAYTFRLHAQLRAFLAETGQLERYDALEKKLQPHLVHMGYRGMPVNQKTRRELVSICKKHEKAANARLAKVGETILRDDYEHWARQVEDLKASIKRDGGKLSDSKEYTSARGKMTRRRKNMEKGFNFDSPPQRAALVYDHLNLPEVGYNGRSTQEEVLSELKLRMQRIDEYGEPAPTVVPRHGSIEDACEILDALIEGKQYATWRRNFLSAPLVPQLGDRRPRMQTEYHLHRAVSNRLSSGTAKDDDDKKEKKQQLQNVPEPLRAPVEADPGHVLVGGDWSNVEWAVVQVLAIAVPDYVKDRLGIPRDFHSKLLNRFLARDLDAHRYLASIVEGIPEADVKKSQRQNCKSYTHGRNFFGSERALAAAAGHTLAMSRRVCQAHHEAFHPEAWWEVARQFVADHGFIECAYGWRRYFEESDPKPTEILGTQVQGSAAELCKYVLLDIFETVYGEFEKTWEILTSTHDSILMQVPEQDKLLAVDWLKRKMEQPIPFLATPEYPKGVCFPADVAAGATWDQV